MKKAVAIFLLGVVVPALALGYLGLRGGDDFERREVERLREQARLALDDAAREARDTIALRTVEAERLLDSWSDPLLPDDGRPLFFATMDGKPAPRPASAEPSDAEAQLFLRSLRGGERKEFVEKDLEGAADAYAFFLSALKTAPLRAAVIYRAAVSLDRAGERELAARLLEEVARRYPGTAGPDGEPLDALALLGLVRLHSVEPSALLERLRRLRHTMDSAWARSLVRAAGLAPVAGNEIPREVGEELARLGRVPPDFACRGRLYHFRRLAGWGVLAGTAVDLRMPVPAAAAAREDIAIHFVPLEGAGIAIAGDKAPPPPDGGDTVTTAPVLTEGDVPIGFAVASSPRLAEIKSAAAKRAFWFHGVVAILLLVTAAGAFFVVRAMRTQLRLLRLKSEFIANVSHEMKTPVSAVRMFAEMLAEDSLDAAKARQFARVLLGESERLSAIVENVLDFNRLERGDMALPIEPVDLAALLSRIIEAFALRAGREGIRFRAETSGARSIASNGDAIARIVQNFLDNAFKYRRGESPEVVLAVFTDGSTVRIEVRDNGIGIPRGEREKIFEKFYRVHPEDVSVRGTGMGLALARALARRLDGQIDVASKVDAGSTFALVLPAGSGKECAR